MKFVNVDKKKHIMLEKYFDTFLKTFKNVNQ